ncbi:MAG: hypothetical protein ABH840_03755, partial [Nanoarchaeota archaeon]
MKKEKSVIHKNAQIILIAFIITLLISLPFAFSYEISEYDSDSSSTPITGFEVSDDSSTSTDTTTSDNSTVPDVGGKCSDKSKKVSSIVKLMDNGIIRTLESVASIMFLICTVMSTIDSILHSVQMFMACCLGPVENWANPACLVQNPKVAAWEISTYIPFVKPLCCFVNCGWCGGIDGKDPNGCWTLGLNKLPNLGMIPSIGVGSGSEGTNFMG